MQIKLVQTEIEEAIRNYIQEQVTVKEGMDINIDLSATRGPEGFIANIEIVRSDGTGGQTAQTTQPQTTAPQPAEPAKPTSRATPTIRKATPIAAPKATETAQEAPQEQTDQIPEGESQEEGSLADEAAEGPPQTTGRSLFGNVDPIKNS